jgi:hypothetical protein
MVRWVIFAEETNVNIYHNLSTEINIISNHWIWEGSIQWGAVIDFEYREA